MKAWNPPYFHHIDGFDSGGDSEAHEIQVTRVLNHKLFLEVGELFDLQTTMDTNTVNCTCMHYSL